MSRFFFIVLFLANLTGALHAAETLWLYGKDMTALADGAEIAAPENATDTEFKSLRKVGANYEIRTRRCVWNLANAIHSTYLVLDCCYVTADANTAQRIAQNCAGLREAFNEIPIRNDDVLTRETRNKLRTKMLNAVRQVIAYGTDWQPAADLNLRYEQFLVQ
jgi:hypothetical protein